MEQAKALLSTDEVAKATGLDVKTVRASIARGDIPGQRFGRLIKVPRWWVDQLLHGPTAAREAA
jgi:excisionase family DNA binding protein